MSKRSDHEIPEEVKSELRKAGLSQLKETPTLDYYELELFDWYVKETETVLKDMLSSELVFIKEQLHSNLDDINDSGMVVVEYYLKRVRYSHVIYMISLLESFLDRACNTLTTVVGEQDIPFTTKELKGDQWSVRRKFLERYGKFTIPDQICYEIKALTILRNNLAHDNGAVCELNAEEKKMLANFAGVKLAGYKVEIEADYIRSAFQAIKSLVTFVEEEIKKIVDKAIQSRPAT